MPSLLDQIPELTVSAAAARPLATSPGAAPARMHDTPDMSRRGFLRIAVTTASALALTGLGWITDRVPAFAVSRTSMHPSNCMGQDRAGDQACWGQDSISRNYCASDRYHRTDRVNNPRGYTKYNWMAACGGYAGWSWRSAVGQAVTCFDGYADSYAGTVHQGRVTTICKYP